jgi:galactose mutarotase-like enzyme
MFVHIQREKSGSAIAELVDPESQYGVRIVGLSPEIKAFQVYAPLDKDFVAIEPQFNVTDPYGKIWPKNFDNGMVLLQPGESVAYAVEVEIFSPSK